MAAALPPASTCKSTMPARTGIPGLDICRKHENEPVSLYCVTCEAPCCSQCLAADHPEPDHTGKDLDTAVQERLQNMQTLTQECQDLKSDVDGNFGQGQTVLDDLDSCYEDLLKDMDRAEENVRIDFERRLRQCRENSMKRLQQLKEQRIQIIQGHMECLKKDRDRLGNAVRVAQQVTNSATKHEVALTYATLARKLERLKEIKPTVISKAHAKIAFRQHDTCVDMFKAEDMGNVITRPGTRGKVSWSHDVKPPAEAFDAASLARHGITLPAKSTGTGILKDAPNHLKDGPKHLKDVPNHLKDAPNHLKDVSNHPKNAPKDAPNHPKDASNHPKDASNHLKDASNHINIMKTEKPSDEETLELAHEFGRDGDGKVQHARGVAVSPVTNDIAVADYDTRQVKIYTSKGDFKFAVDTKQGNKWDSDSKPWDVAVSSEGEYLVTDKTPYVKVYDPEGKSIGRFPAFSPDGERSDVDDVGLYCIATDSKGEVLVGAGNFYVSIHSAAREGCHLNSISVRIPPGFMATTLHGYVVIGSWSQQKVMIIDQAGVVLHSLKPPPGMPTWRPRGVCCSDDDEVYVANQVTGKTPGKSGIHRYQIFTGEHLGCVTNDVKAPLGVGVLCDKSVVVAEKSVVKIFKWTGGNEDDSEEDNNNGGSGGGD